MRDLLAFPDSSRVWIYQADRALPPDEIGTVNANIDAFSKEWTSHNRQLHATGGLLHDTFVILVADESRAGASGCSIDASVRYVRELGEKYRVDFFDRLTFTYLDGDQIRHLHKDQLSQAYKDGRITDDTLFFDNLVKSKAEFIERWVTPLGQSWIRRFI